MSTFFLLLSLQKVTSQFVDIVDIKQWPSSQSVGVLWMVLLSMTGIIFLKTSPAVLLPAGSVKFPEAGNKNKSREKGWTFKDIEYRHTSKHSLLWVLYRKFASLGISKNSKWTEVKNREAAKKVLLSCPGINPPPPYFCLWKLRNTPSPLELTDPNSLQTKFNKKI